jgi:hypothetical protein
VRFGIVILLAACNYAPPDGGTQTATDSASPDDSSEMGTNPDGPTPGSDAPLPPDGPIIAACVGYAPLVGASPAGATYRGVSTRTPWGQARSNCQGDGGDLVVIDNATEAAAVTTLAEDPGTSPGPSPYIWMGVMDNPDTGTDNDWISVRGGAATYAPWGGSQPTGGSQDCALLEDQGPPHEFFDFGCTATQVFVCECLP